MRKDTDPARTPDQTGNLVHIGIFLPYKAAPVRPEEQLPIEVPIKVVPAFQKPELIVGKDGSYDRGSQIADSGADRRNHYRG